MKFLRILKEVFFSSLPLALIILVICGVVAPLENMFDYVKLAVGYIGVVLGQALFLEGLDISILPIGKHVGSSLARFEKIPLIVAFGVLFGVLATVAEPALTVLARQTNMIMPIVDETVFVWIMSLGIGLFVGFAMFRIIKNLNIKIVFVTLYVLVFLLVPFVPQEFIALSFDGSGATTGDVSVPFILALGLGISGTMTKSKKNEDTFGIIGIASVGPILALFVYGILLKLTHGSLPAANVYDPGAAESFGSVLSANVKGVALALVPVVLVFLPFQFWMIRLSRRELVTIFLGTVMVYAGLLIFLSCIDFGFAFAGKYIGEVFLAASRPEWFKWLLLPLGFVLGMAITLSEPAVSVLGDQLEEITNGHIQKMTIRITLALGIGVASLLSILKILTQINILWFLIPLYAIALLLLKYTSGLFVGLAFDSGGVTGGALTSAFLTPLTLGVAQAVAETAGPGAQSVLTNGFGIIAFISVTPLIAVQALGIIYEAQVRKAQALNAEAARAEEEDLMLLASEEEDARPDGGEDGAPGETADEGIQETEVKESTHV